MEFSGWVECTKLKTIDSLDSAPSGCRETDTLFPKVHLHRLKCYLPWSRAYLGLQLKLHLAGNEGRREPKVTTLILYDEHDSPKFKWGAQVSRRNPAVHGVKLLLDPDQAKPSYIPVASFKKDCLALPKDPIDVTADFISDIYKHALTVIEAAGVRDHFKYCQKDFVLTVPAVWSDKAMDLTLKVTSHAHLLILFYRCPRVTIRS